MEALQGPSVGCTHLRMVLSSDSPYPAEPLGEMSAKAIMLVAVLIELGSKRSQEPTAQPWSNAQTLAQLPCRLVGNRRLAFRRNTCGMFCCVHRLESNDWHSLSGVKLGDVSIPVQGINSCEIMWVGLRVATKALRKNIEL